MSQRPYDARACPLAVRSVTAHVKTCLLAQISLRCLTFQHHDPVVIAGYSAHGRESPRVGLPRTVPRRHCSPCRCLCHRLCPWSFLQPSLSRSVPDPCRTRIRSCQSCRQPVSSASCRPEPFFPEPLSPPLSLRRGGVSASTSIGVEVESEGLTVAFPDP